jgi:AraC family transcriptional regulator of adaptative response/methylated-DNA-[protein]-cysteine methyltransferase
LNLAPDYDTVRSNRSPFANVRYTLGTCTLGAILVAVADDGICAILLGDDGDALASDLQRRLPQALAAQPGFKPAFAPAFAPSLASVLADVIALVEAPHVGLALPLALRGTPFQLRLWQALRQIPLGHTVSYAELASIVGVPGGARAVAGACAANALALAIPCHRVLRSNGALSGYRWGVPRKQALLEREAAWLNAFGPGQ